MKNCMAKRKKKYYIKKVLDRQKFESKEKKLGKKNSFK